MMSIDSPMLGSIYSRVEEPLRKSPSKYKTINKEKETRHRGIGIGEGRREIIKGNVPEEISETLGWRILREGTDYIY